jgi:hypothetical protein
MTTQLFMHYLLTCKLLFTSAFTYHIKNTYTTSFAAADTRVFSHEDAARRGNIQVDHYSL